MGMGESRVHASHGLVFNFDKQSGLQQGGSETARSEEWREARNCEACGFTGLLVAQPQGVEMFKGVQEISLTQALSQQCLLS